MDRHHATCRLVSTSRDSCRFVLPVRAADGQVLRGCGRGVCGQHSTQGWLGMSGVWRGWRGSGNFVEWEGERRKHKEAHLRSAKAHHINESKNQKKSTAHAQEHSTSDVACLRDYTLGAARCCDPNGAGFALGEGTRLACRCIVRLWRCGGKCVRCSPRCSPPLSWYPGLRTYPAARRCTGMKRRARAAAPGRHMSSSAPSVARNACKGAVHRTGKWRS